MSIYSSSRNSGNVLFLILIAVALFAALTYVVVQSTRTHGASLGEKDISEAARIMNYIVAVNTGITKLSLGLGLPFQQLLYNNDVSLRINGVPINGALGSPADPSRYLFHPQGGAVIPQLFEEISDPCPTCPSSAWRPGHFAIMWSNMGQTDTADLVLLIERPNIRICNAFNEKVNLSSIPTIDVLHQAVTTTNDPPTLATSSVPEALGRGGFFCARNFVGQPEEGLFIYNVIQLN